MKALEFVLKLNDQVTTPLDKIQRGFTNLEITLTRVQKQLTGIARLIRKMPKVDFGKFTGFGGDFAAGFRGGSAASRARARANPASMLALPAISHARANPVPMLALPAPKAVAPTNVIDVVATPVPVKEISRLQRRLDKLRGLAKIPLSLVPTRAKAISGVRGQLDKLRGAGARVGQSLMRALTVRRSAPASFRNLRREMFSTERSANRLRGVMRGVWSVPTALATGAGAFGLGQFGRFATGATVAQQQRVVSLSNLTKGSAYSTPQALMDSLEEFYLRNPAFNFADTINQYRQFRNAGFEDTAAKRQMELAAGMVAAGYTPDAINRLTYAKSQILTSGTLYGGEVQQINDIISMPELRQNIADILNARDGTSLDIGNIKDMQSEGLIGSDIALQAINMIEKRIGGGMIEQYRNSLPGLFNSAKFLFTKAFQGVETSPLEELLKTVNSLLMEGSGTLEIFQGTVNNLYGKTFGKLAKYLKTLVEDPEKAARAIKDLSQWLDRSISIVTDFGRGIWDVGKGIADFLSWLQPAFSWLNRLTGSMDDSEMSAARWAGRIFAGVLVLDLLNTGFGMAASSLKLLGGVLGGALPVIGAITAGIGIASLVTVGWIAAFGDMEAAGRALSAAMRGDWKMAWEEWQNAVVTSQPQIMAFFNGLWGIIDKVGESIRGVTSAWTEFITVDKGPFAKLFDSLALGMGLINDETAALAALAPKSQDILLPEDFRGGSSGGRNSSNTTNTTMNQVNNINMPAGSSPEEVGEAVSRRTAQSLERLALAAGHSPRFTT